MSDLFRFPFISWWLPAPLYIHIIKIIFCCSYPQMIWIDAMPYITRMADKLTIWYRTKFQNITHSMSSIFFKFINYNSISMTIKPADPKPTFIRFENFVKKSFFNWHWNSIILEAF